MAFWFNLQIMTADIKPNGYVLFIDDEAVAGKYFQEIFGSEFPVLTTTDIQEAWEMIRTRGPEISIIVSDQRMPAGSGVELLSEVNRQFPAIIRVLTTAYASLDSSLQAINQGRIFAYVTKPWDIENMRATLHSAYDEFNKRQALLALAGSIAHEMRTPLSQVNLGLEGIGDMLPAEGDQISAEQITRLSRFVNLGKSAVKRGNQMIAMILASIKSNTVDSSEFEYLSAARATQKAVDEYSFSWRDASGARCDLRDRVSVRVGKDFIFHGNETAYVFVLFNLIKNALYYFGQKPEATLVLTVDDYKVTVRDTGPGIAQEVLAHLFESFMTSGKAEGTGLGLAYCQRTMQSFDGDIRCDSVLGEFTEFTLSFPVLPGADLQTGKLPEVKQLAAVLEPQAAAPALAGNGLEGKTVILAEDDELHRTMMSDMLQDWGMTVLEAQGGNQVLAHLHNTPGVDLILMDMNMPGLGGVQTTRAIRSRDWAHQRVSILALTGNSDESDIKAAMTAGVNDLIVKSGDMKFLRKKMTEIFAATQEGRKLPAH